jgi:NAD(P)-dependent dehydrogenase (short-subunit alcohol dehydrogenase family)
MFAPPDRLEVKKIRAVSLYFNKHLKRIGSPQESAGAAAHLLSGAGAWITGQVIPIDGGLSSLRTFR